MSERRITEAVRRTIAEEAELASLEAQVRREGGVRFPPRRSIRHVAAWWTLASVSPFALMFGADHLLPVLGFDPFWVEPTHDAFDDSVRALLGIALGLAGLYYAGRERRIDALASSPREAIRERAAHLRETGRQGT